MTKVREPPVPSPSTANQRRCAWCARPFVATSGPGRPRRFCKQSCRQRDYESRTRSQELGLGEHELVVTRQELESLRDRLYVLQCAVEDVERDLNEATDESEIKRALEWLLEAAKESLA